MRSIPVQLQTELNKTVSKVTLCLRFNLEDGTVFGITKLDRDVVYDHGDAAGEVTYYAASGFDPSIFQSDTSYGVANAEARALVGGSVPGLTVEMVQTGALDNGTWTAFLVNFANPATGTAMVLDAGDIGEARIERGMVIVPELLSYSMRFSQAVGSVFQRGCRAIFGMPRAHPLGCGVDAEALWQDFTVTAVGAETDRLFETDITSTSGDGWFPGRVQWETGDNTSTRLYATEATSEDSGGGTVTLAETTPYAIQVGDTGRIRADCTKQKDGPLGCAYYDNYINMNAEDNTPVGDATAGTAPGGNLPGGGGYVGELPPPSEE